MGVRTCTYALDGVVIDLDVAFDLLTAVKAEFDLFAITPFQFDPGTRAFLEAFSVDHQSVLSLDDDPDIQSAQRGGDERTETVGARGVGEGFGEGDWEHGCFVGEFV
jgi:hypothetical protein